MISSNCSVSTGFSISSLSKFCVVSITMVRGRYVCPCLIHSSSNVNNNAAFNLSGECGSIPTFRASWSALLKPIPLMSYTNW